MSDKIKKITDSCAQSKESIAEFIWELICCLLLSVGTCYLIDAQFPFQAGVLNIILHCAITLVAISLITRKWWLFVGVIGISVLGIGGWLVLTDAFAGFIDGFKGFFTWWFSNLPQDSNWFSEQNINVVLLIIHIGVSVGFFAILRLTRRAWPSLVICILVLIVVMAFGVSANNSVSVAFYVAGVLPLLAKEHFSGRRMFVRKNKISILGERWVVTTVAGVLCAAIAIGTFLLLPTNNENLRTRFFSNITADFQSATELYTTEQKTAIDITLYDLGLQYSPHYIGGNLRPIKPGVIAVTDSAEPLLLKVTSYDVYDGVKWESDFKRNYRINGIWKDEETQLLSGPVTKDKEQMDKILKYIAPKEVTIISTTKSNMLVSVAQTMSFTERTKTKNPILFNEKGEMFSYFTLPKGYRYTINYLAYPTNVYMGEQGYKIMLEASSTGEDPLYDNQEFYDHYTALPKNYSKYAKTLVEEFLSKTGGKHEALIAINNYFSSENGFTYTPLPGWIKNGENVIDKLLETKKGHCGYYATAIVAMAREIGIPSRLAAGYKTVLSGDGKYQIVNVASPYCWAECYIRNIGWVAFDPSPDSKPIILVEGVGDGENKLPELEIMDDFFANDFNEEEINSSNSADTGDLIDLPKGTNVLLWISIIFISAFAYLLLRTAFSQLCYKIPFVKLMYRTEKNQAEFYYRDILRLLGFMGYVSEVGETLNELLDRLGAPLDKELIEKLKTELNIIEQMHYNNMIPSSSDVTTLCNLRLILEESARKNSNIFKYMLFRRTLLPVVIFI